MADEATLTENSAPETVTTEAASPNELAATALGGADAEPAADADTQAAETEAEAETDSAKDETGEDAAPVVPEKYELKASEGLPELDAEAVALAEPVFKEIGLTNEQAQQLVPVAEQFAQRIAEQMEAAATANVAQQRAAWLAEAQAAEDIGGAKWSDTLVAAAKGLDALGFTKGTPFRDLLDDSGLGNHPDMIRAWLKVGRAVSEDSDFVRSGVATAGARTLADTLYPSQS